MAVNDQKVRILFLMEIMLERTDENHCLNATQLCDILSDEYGIETERKTIYSDIEVLKRFHMDIEKSEGKNAGYYVASREFELAELKLLVDAVQASKFLTEKKSRDLIEKLEKLCSREEAKQLSKQVIIYNRPKTSNETIYYNVDQLHTAIYQKRQISFQYTAWNVKKQLELKKNGARYIVSPWSLNWDEENYYLIAYDEQNNQIKHYRVDKMRNIEILEAERVGEDVFEGFNIVDFSKKTFGMFGGRDVEVTLRCHNILAGVILDRFGQDIWMIPDGEEYFKAHVEVKVSPQFFGWVTGIGKNMQIVGPQDVKEEYRKYLQNILDSYE